MLGSVVIKYRDGVFVLVDSSLRLKESKKWVITGFSRIQVHHSYIRILVEKYPSSFMRATDENISQIALYLSMHLVRAYRMINCFTQ